MLLAVRSINIQIDIPLRLAVWLLFWQKIGAKPLSAHSRKVLNYYLARGNTFSCMPVDYFHTSTYCCILIK